MACQNEYYVHRDFLLTHPPVKTFLNHFRARNIIKDRNQGFENFLKDYLELMPISIVGECVNVDGVQFDLYITGSDQVWNDRCARFDRNFFLDFPCARLKKRASYAASFGMKQIPAEKRNEFLSMFVIRYIDVNKTVHMKIRKPIIVGSVLIGGMLIGTYYCGNKIIQFVALCITAIYAMLTNVDMLKSGVNLVKSRLGK